MSDENTGKKGKTPEPAQLQVDYDTAVSPTGRFGEALNLTPEARAAIEEVNLAGEAFVRVLRRVGNGRQLSIAITNAQQAVLWAVHGLSQ